MIMLTLILLLAAGHCVYSIDLIQPDSRVVQPGQPLTITCRVSGYSVSDNSYATGWVRHCGGKPMEWIFHQWGGGNFYKNDALKNKFSYSRDTSAGTVTITGQNLQPEDTVVYYCVRARGNHAFDYWGKGTTVTVTSASPSSPTLFPLIPCGSESGDMVTLGCLATSFNPPSVTFSWTKQGNDKVPDFIQYPAIQKGDSYNAFSQVRVSRQDWESRQSFQCTVGDRSVSITKSVTFHKNATLKVFSSSDEDGSYTYSCFAKEFAPKKHAIKWQKDGEDITSKAELFSAVSEPIKMNGNNVFNAASFLTVNTSDVGEEPQISCLFEGGQNQFLNQSVNYITTSPGPGNCDGTDITVNIIKPRTDSMLLHKKGTVTCQVKAEDKGLSITWENEDGNEIVSKPMSKVNGNGKTYESELDITFDEWTTGVKRFCVVHHEDLLEPRKELYERKSGGKLVRPSVFMLPPLEHTSKAKVTLTCYVKDFFPKEVYVSWLVNDEEANTSAFSTTEPIEKSGSYSAYSQLFVSLDEWQRHDAVYNCVVYHESVVNTTKALVRSIGYKTFANTNLVNLNMNIPETCKAQ